MSTELARREGAEVEVFQEWTPAALRAQVAVEKERRQVIIEYYQSCMVEGHHYYRLDDDEKKKPALSKEGALNLCGLFKVRPDPEPPTETWTPDGHYTVRYRTRLISLTTGTLVATGDGFCSTRESKYAYRYAARACPVCGKAAIIKGREDYGGGWLCFRRKDGCGAKFREGDAVIESQVTGRVPNEDLADSANTVLKMSEKRSLVDGALKLPLASELFIQDLEEQIVQRQQGEWRETERSASVSRPVVHVGGTSVTDVPGSADRPAAAPKPTVEEVTQLLAFLQGAYQDPAVVDTKLRATMGIPMTQKDIQYRVKSTMTRAHHDQLQAEAEAFVTKGTTAEDVPDFSGPEPTPLPSGATTVTDGGDPAVEVETSPTEADRGIDESAGEESRDVRGEDLPRVEVDADGHVVPLAMARLALRAGEHDQRLLLEQLKMESPQMTEPRYHYAWVQVGKQAKVKG